MRANTYDEANLKVFKCQTVKTVAESDPDIDLDTYKLLAKSLETKKVEISNGNFAS